MFRILLLVCAIGLASAIAPVEESEYVKIYKLSDVESRALLRNERPFRAGQRSVVEYPYNGTVPSDYGGNFGDLTFPSSIINKNGTLIARDTIINTYASENLLILYYREFNVSYVEDFQLLNFGRQRGFADYASIWHTSGYVEGEILVAANNYVRILAETYRRA